MASLTSLPLQQFVAFLDKSSLPKILKVCSGVYFQGSVYELSGSEVCFSTGDLFKITNLELLSVCCEDISSHEKFELQINHKGLFKVIPEDMAYSSIEEMVRMRPVCLDSSLPFTFTLQAKLTLGTLTLGAGRALTMICVESREGEEDHLRCHVQGTLEASAEVCLPLSTRGEFHVQEGQECFTLMEIVSSPHLCCQRFRFINTSMCDRCVILSPIYEIHAIMDMRKDIMKFCSNLDVDVIDVTNVSKDLKFEVPLSLTDMWSQPGECFPAVVMILDKICLCPLLKSTWLPLLKKPQQLVFHEKGISQMVLMSTVKSRRTKYFLVSQHYGGKFRRRPREFRSVFEVYAASYQVAGLRVSVTGNQEEEQDEGLPALTVGEELEVVGRRTVELPSGHDPAAKQLVSVLACRRLQGDGDDDDDDEDEPGGLSQEVLLPLSMQGHFVELLRDNKKYSLKDLGMQFSAPIDLKVVTRDAKQKEDPLTVGSLIRVEGALLEPTIKASFLHTPENRFEIPVQRLSLSCSLTNLPLPSPREGLQQHQVDTVTEVTEAFVSEFNKQKGVENPPPPRPPKRSTRKTLPTNKSLTKVDGSKDKSESLPTPEIQFLNINSDESPLDVEKRQPPVPRRKSRPQIDKAQPNMDVQKINFSSKPAPPPPSDEDNDHDYETVDEVV